MSNKVRKIVSVLIEFEPEEEKQTYLKYTKYGKSNNGKYNGFDFEAAEITIGIETGNISLGDLEP